MSNNYITNYRKFAELLIYTLSKFSEPVNETKLLKLLYFADANNYEKTGRTISGNVTYYKNHYGPTPNYKILKNLYTALGDYLVKDEKHEESHKFCKLAVKNSNYTFKSLSAAEIEVIEQAIATYGKLSLNNIVKLSHLDPPYLASKSQKKINFDMVRFRKNDDEYEEGLSAEMQQSIANDISISARRKLKEYAGSAT